MTLKTKFGAFATLAALGLAAGHPAAAQNSAITFSSVHAVSSDSDVSTTGTLFEAYYFNNTPGAPNVTVNSVPFTNAFIAGGPNVTITGSNQGYNSGLTPFPSASTNYNNILVPYIYNSDGTPAIKTLGFTITGLRTGDSYQFQYFVDEARGNSGRTDTLSDGLGHASAALAVDTGSYVFGTFTANSAGSETFTTTSNAPQPGGYGDAAAQVNAFQIRDITAAPEPSQFAAFGLGILGLAGMAFKARKRSVIA
jgi:hypothetical protein